MTPASNASWVSFQTVPVTSESPTIPVAIPVAYMEPLPLGCLTASRLLSLVRTLNRLEVWYRQRGKHEKPCLRLVQGARDGRITALIQVGELTLKVKLKDDDWIVLGDALKICD